MNVSQSLRVLTLGACASLALTACAGGAATQSGSKDASNVTIGLTYIPNVQFAPVYVADAQGMYNDAGISATIRHHGSHEGFFTALLAGEEDVVIASGDEAAVAASQGLDIVSIGQYYATYPGTVIVPESSDITTLADLKGKTVGIPGEHGANYYATRSAMQSAGLAESDVTISPIGYTQQAAIASGQVDAVVGFTNNDAVQMRLAGLEIREIPLDPSTPLVSASIITTHTWAQEHPEQARAVVKATTDAMNVIAANPQIAIDATKKWDDSLVSEDSLAAANAVLAATVPLWVGENGQASGAQDLNKWAQMVTFLGTLGELGGGVDPAMIATNDYVTQGEAQSSAS